VGKGEVGVKTGRGFHQYSPESIESTIRGRDEFLVKRLKELHPSGDS